MAIPKSKEEYEDVERRWMESACTHRDLKLFRRTMKDGRIDIVRQCQSCGDIKGGAVKKLPEHDSLPERDETLFPAYNKARQELRTELLWESDLRLYEAWMANYRIYLDSPEWKNKSRLVIQRENGVCEGCREAKATQAHHSTYRDLESEFLFQLVALCRPCHERYHSAFVSFHRPTRAAGFPSADYDSGAE